VLFRPGVRADMFNRFKLGRSLDEVSSLTFLVTARLSSNIM
jgi:hypothetical protein